MAQYSRRALGGVQGLKVGEEGRDQRGDKWLKVEDNSFRLIFPPCLPTAPTARIQLSFLGWLLLLTLSLFSNAKHRIKVINDAYKRYT